MLLYEPNFPILPSGHLMVESNMSAALDGINIGDEYLQRILNRPNNWRWRSPDYNAIKQENTELNTNMNFSCNMPTLDSFAAFSDGEIDQEPGIATDFPSSPPVQTQSNYWEIADLITPDPSPAARPAAGRPQPVTTQNPLIDALTGIIKGTTPAIATSLSQRIAPGQRPVSAGARPASAAASSNMTPIIIAGAAILGLVFISKK